MSLNTCILNESVSLSAFRREKLWGHCSAARVAYLPCQNDGGPSVFGGLKNFLPRPKLQCRAACEKEKEGVSCEGSKASRRQLLAVPLAMLFLCAPPDLEALADGGKRVGTFAASGFLFKDTVEVTAFSDPKVEGVTVHVSNMDYSAIDKIRKGFSDPAQSSVTCTQTGPLRLLQPIAMGPEGEEVFSESRSFLFKSVHVRRIYDSVNNALVYVAYSTRLVNPDETGSRFKTSIASISLYNQGIDFASVTP